MNSSSDFQAGTLASNFEHRGAPTFGVEEEVMLLDPQTLDLLPRAAELVEGLDGRFKIELPASQLEIASGVATSMTALAEELAAARNLLAAHLAGRALPAGAGVHPFAPGRGILNRSDRNDRLLAEYGDILRRQLICGLHVHIGIPGAARALAVYNTMRNYLPPIAALAANASIYEGADSGMASVRPVISGLLPRQGIPPIFNDWSEYAAALNWGGVGRTRQWWWELRLHPLLGTLEVRVPDAQSTVADTMAVTAMTAALALHLAERNDAGDLPAPAPTWRINRNRWSAARYGLNGSMVDPTGGETEQTRAVVRRLLDGLAVTAQAIGGAAHLKRAYRLLEHNGSEAQQEVFAESGAAGVAGWLGGRFLS